MERNPAVSFFGGLVLFVGSTSIGILDALGRLDFLHKSNPTLYAGLTSVPSMLAVGSVGIASMLWGGWQFHKNRIASAVETAIPQAPPPISTVTHGANSPAASVSGDVKDSSLHVGDVHHHYGEERHSSTGHADKRIDPIATDQKTLECLQQVLPSNIIADLRVQSFHGQFTWKREVNFVLKEFCNWESSPEHRFLDEDLEEIHRRLRNLAHTLYDRVHRYTEILSQTNPEVRGFIPIDRAGDATERAERDSHCNEVWETKDKLCDTYESLSPRHDESLREYLR